MTQKWLAALYIIANLLFAWVIAEQWFALRQLPDLINNYAEYSNKAFSGLNSGLNKAIAQGLFYTLGTGLSLAVLVGLFKNTGVPKKWLLAYGVYFLAFILLELPLYNEHFGWGDSHGHSFWHGLHFH
jgi:hypothetical protein